jgi:hypothetical protein
MRWLVAAAMVLMAAPAYGQDNEAEKLYRAMEKKVREAKSIRVIWNAEFDFGIVKGETIKGVSQLADGNKLRIEFEGRMLNEDAKMLRSTPSSRSSRAWMRSCSSCRNN